MKLGHCFEVLFLIYFTFPTSSDFNLCKNGGTMIEPGVEHDGSSMLKVCRCLPEWEGFLCGKRKCGRFLTVFFIY